jgi:hypothetical protein
MIHLLGIIALGLILLPDGFGSGLIIGVILGFVLDKLGVI